MILFDLHHNHNYKHLFSSILLYTRKNAQVATNLQQTCSTMLFQQLVNRMCSHVLLAPSLLTSCPRLVDNLLQGCWARQTCYKLSNNWLSSCNSTICQRVVSDNLVATWWNNMIVTTCWQACYKPVANTSCWQVVRFLRVYLGVSHVIRLALGDQPQMETHLSERVKYSL
jgi:hypothetical protein